MSQHIDEDTGRVTYLGTGIGNLEAAKGYLQQKFSQQPAEAPVSRPGHRFYVSVRNAGQAGFLLGPYASHMMAQANLAHGRQLAMAASDRSCWYSFGTASSPETLPTLFGRQS